MNTRSHILPATAQNYARAADVLAGGGLVALPTETVYGLAGDARNDAAVARIYAVKGRPAHNPLIAHVLSVGQAGDLARLCPLAEATAARFWPGPVTLVLPRKNGEGLSPLAGAGRDTIALRCPKAPWTDSFARSGFHGPLFMPSANRSGRVSPTTAAHVAADLGDAVDMIIDGGPCPIGLESTVVKIAHGRGTVLRPGAVTLDDLRAFDPRFSNAPMGDDIVAPGMLKSHYAPKAAVRLNVTQPKAGEAHLGFGTCYAAPGLNLSPSGDLAEAATHLFDYLRRLDTVDTIAVAPIPDHGIGRAINDRLGRAAAEREA